jgi:hypothetical protein
MFISKENGIKWNQGTVFVRKIGILPLKSPPMISGLLYTGYNFFQNSGRDLQNQHQYPYQVFGLYLKIGSQSPEYLLKLGSCFRPALILFLPNCI